jgi:3-hydroxybutyryl-CoA dehydrogenase
MKDAPTFAAVGAGRMGRGIAIAFAYAGHRIALVDAKPRSAPDWARLRAEAYEEIVGSLGALAQLGVLREDQVESIAKRIELLDAAAAPAALAGAELVFEGVPETFDAKRDVFDKLSAWCSRDAILASTTSSMSATRLAELVEHPRRFLNVHWLNPAYIIPVVELATHAGTAPEVTGRTKTHLESIGKLPVVCRDTPGYIVPRLQALVMNEAARMIEEGAATAEEIDKATRFGLGLRFAAIGVVEFIDYGGADILHHASRELSASVDPARYRAPDILDRMMASGELGLKTGRGFYRYDDRDMPAYRRDVLARTLAMLRNAGLWRPPADGKVR